jgi:hypothetical protein
VAAFAAVLVGMIGIAVGSRAPATPPLIPPVALASSGPMPGATTAPAATVRSERASRAPIPTSGPVRTSDPDSIQIRIEAQRHPGTIYVHGDVYVANVTWVFVSLRDAAGRVAGWASVSVPGAAGPALKDGPTLRFDVELAVPAEFSGPLWIQANAYDQTARIIGSTRLDMSPGLPAVVRQARD